MMVPQKRKITKTMSPHLKSWQLVRTIQSPRFKTSSQRLTPKTTGLQIPQTRKQKRRRTKRKNSKIQNQRIKKKMIMSLSR